MLLGGHLPAGCSRCLLPVLHAISQDAFKAPVALLSKTDGISITASLYVCDHVFVRRNV